MSTLLEHVTEENISLREMLDQRDTEIINLRKCIKGLSIKNQALVTGRKRCAFQYQQECKHLNAKIKRQASKIDMLEKRLLELLK